jgi:hypothetical protein
VDGRYRHTAWNCPGEEPNVKLHAPEARIIQSGMHTIFPEAVMLDRLWK